MDSRTVRHTTDMTQEDLAKAIGVSRRTISDFEKGKTKSKKVDLKIQNYFKNNDFDESNKRVIYAQLQAALVIVREAMDKLELSI